MTNELSGIELREAVATTIMGWSARSTVDALGRMYDRAGSYPTPATLLPAYERDIAAAWDVYPRIEALVEQGKCSGAYAYNRFHDIFAQDIHEPFWSRSTEWLATELCRAGVDVVRHGNPPISEVLKSLAEMWTPEAQAMQEADEIEELEEALAEAREMASRYEAKLAAVRAAKGDA